MYYTVYAFLAIIIINPPPPPNKTKQQQQKKLALLWAYSGTFMRGSKQGKRLAGTDHAGAGEMKVCPCYTDSSIMSSKMRKSTRVNIFSTRVNLVKQDGPKIYKYHAGIASWDRGRTPLLVLYTGFIQHVAIQLHNALGYFQIDRNQDKQRKGEKYRTTTNNQKEQRKQ